jgi:uncharacterized FlaG/YvyC family protein
MWRLTLTLNTRQSECYHTNWTELFKSKKKAQQRYREVLEDEFKKHHSEDPKELTTEDLELYVERMIEQLTDEDNSLDYEFFLNLEEAETED